MPLIAGAREYIWPEGRMPFFQERQFAAMTDEAERPDFDPAAHRLPYVEWYDPPAEPNGCCMILVSGGGYDNCCDVGLVDMWREHFTKHGYSCVNFVYRTPRPAGAPIHGTAWADGQRAVRLVRSQAAKRGYDPEKIGTVSMSAGSHLAALLATSALARAYDPADALDEIPCHIAWAVTGSIAYALSDGVGAPNATGGNGPDVALDACFAFDEKTCPMCMFHGENDPYSPIASTKIYRRLREKNIPAELHLFAGREHGFWGDPHAPEETARAYDTCLDRAVEFLNVIGCGRKTGACVNLLGDRFNGDGARGGYMRENVWPEGRAPDGQSDFCTPYLEWHFPKTRRTDAIQIIFSGGAYFGNDPDEFEVAPARRFLNERGMTVVTLKYRSPRSKSAPKHLPPWQDLQRAVRVVRGKARGLGLDPDRIGIMGSSAGGHLAMLGATSSSERAYAPVDALDEIPCNANLAVAIYPAYMLTDGTDGSNAERGNPDSAVLVPELKFDAESCPVLFIHGDADDISAMGSVKAWEKLRTMGVQCDLHTLAKCGHCFQRSAPERTGAYTWLGRIREFMNQTGFSK